MGIWIVTSLLILSVYLLITEKIPIDLTAIGIMVALALTGILTPAESVAGLANPAVVTVGAMFLISQAMLRTGAVAYIGHKVVDLARGKARLAMLIILLIVASASAFINNTPVVVLFIPVVISMGCRFNLNPSKYLIPISYASILAGTCTLIGTSTNIIVSDLSAQYGFGTLGMFELAPAGVPLAAAGLLLIFFLAPRVLPDLPNAACEMNDGHSLRRYLAEVAVTRGSALVGLNPCADLPARHPQIEVVELVRYSHIYHPCRDPVAIAPDDLLVVKGPPNALMQLLNEKGVDLPQAEKGLRFGGPDETQIIELIIPPSSSLVGQRLRETGLTRDADLHIVAIERAGLHYTEKQIQDIRLRNGDILLIWTRVDRLESLRGSSDWIVAEQVQQTLLHKRKAPLAGAIFTAMVIAAATGLLGIMTAGLAAVMAMVLTGCLPLREAYRSLQGRVLLLIAGTIALGLAMDKTGTSRLYAELFLKVLDGLPPILILGGFVLLTSLGSQILSNNATAVLMLPIAISTAVGLGVHPKAFIMAVVFGASACFASPIGYQTNLLVYGPGGYRFSDYLKLGIPLNLLVVVGATLLIPRLWPF
jgi:di/tricarboxylate transporter